MYKKPEERIKELDKEFIKIQVLEAPGTIMVGLGLYGKFAANGNAFHPFLNDQSNVNILLILGGAIMAWGTFKSISIITEKARLKNRHDV